MRHSFDDLRSPSFSSLFITYSTNHRSRRGISENAESRMIGRRGNVCLIWQAIASASMPSGLYSTTTAATRGSLQDLHRSAAARCGTLDASSKNRTANMCRAEVFAHNVAANTRELRPYSTAVRASEFSFGA